MRDTVRQSPVTKAAFKGAKIAIDLIYLPKETEFLRLAKEKDLRTINGEAMLFYQAYYSDCLYLARQADETQARALYQRYLTKHED
jgi:shikimate dehydrogenase